MTSYGLVRDLLCECRSTDPFGRLQRLGCRVFNTKNVSADDSINPCVIRTVQYLGVKSETTLLDEGRGAKLKRSDNHANKLDSTSRDKIELGFVVAFNTGSEASTQKHRRTLSSVTLKAAPELAMPKPPEAGRLPDHIYCRCQR